MSKAYHNRLFRYALLDWRNTSRVLSVGIAAHACQVRRSPPTSATFGAGDIMTWWAHGSPLKATHISTTDEWTVDKWVEYDGNVTYANPRKPEL